MTEILYTEQALEAWMEAQPNGVILPLDKLRAALASLNVPLSEDEVISVFKSFISDGEEADGISFLVFWKAWAHLSRLQERPITSANRNSELQDLLFLELQTFRDTLLRFSAVERRDFPMSYLFQETEKTRKMSECPAFWDTCKDTLGALDGGNDKMTPRGNGESTCSAEEKCMSIEEVTVLLISWLLEAVSFQRERAMEEDRIAREQQQQRERSQAEEENRGLPVYIHVYDVSQEPAIRKLNRFTANKFSPLKFGGVFHAGVEVAELEWSYGASVIETMPGIVCHEIKTHPQHRYRQTVFMGFTRLTAEEVADLIGELVELYPGWDYDLLRRNCCHFADDMCQRMGVGQIPGWIYRFARVGAGFDAMITAIKGLRSKKDDEGTAILNS
eukprot:GEMP01017210.1.p1 GENE.GEMP01017210.1~~GEMP01017210.1.p1  ORF type:complete len:389 (+),score=87.59 GEMP01017210.1:135-1301(+)